MKDIDNLKLVVASGRKLPTVLMQSTLSAPKLREGHLNIWQVIFNFFLLIVSPERTIQAPLNINETYTLTY